MHVGVVGSGLTAYWARLGRVRLAAEIPQRDAALFWSPGAKEGERALTCNTVANVQLWVGTLPEGGGDWAPFSRVGDTAYGIYSSPGRGAVECSPGSGSVVSSGESGVNSGSVVADE